MRPNLFLDLDNTLIFAEEVKIPDAINNAINYEYDYFAQYIIAARPNLQLFLDYVFKNFNVSIWTAATKDYGLFIWERFIKAYDSSRELKYFLHRTHCNYSFEITGYTKSLSMLWDNWNRHECHKENTFIVDDLEGVFKAQPLNTFLIKPFYATDPYDFELLNIIDDLESKINP